MKSLRLILLLATMCFVSTINAQVTVTSKGVGNATLKLSKRALPKTMTGLYNKLRYDRQENEMEGYVEESYVGSLNGKKTVKFTISEGRVDQIEFYPAARIVLQTSSGKINPWTTNAKTLFAKKAVAKTNGYYYSGFYMKLGSFSFLFGDNSYTAAGQRKVASREGEESFALSSADIKPTACPTSIMIY